jgi:hypothetical protein
MLQSFATKSGTGISIFGDYGDLHILYDTIHHFANTLDENRNPQKGQHLLLMNFAYEIRKAYSGQRLIEKLTYNGENVENTFYGLQLVWIDILIFISTLRHNAGYTSSDKLHQANLYLLEFIVEKALFEYDAEGANHIKRFIGQGINVTDEFAFIIFQALHIKYVTDKAGKARFRKIPKLLVGYFSKRENDYKELIASFKQLAKEQNCEVTDLEFSDFPEIMW